MSRKRKGTIAVLIGLTGVAACLAGRELVYWWRDYPVHHFAVVEEGVIYRCGQPDPGQIGWLADRYGIRTVVNLRGERVEAPWWRAETAACGKRGLTLADVDMDEGALAEANIMEFLEIVGDPANRPVLVHCEAGSARTGFAVAAYRIVFDGWSYDKALAEAKEFHFNLGSKTNREYMRVLRLLADGHVTRGDPPASWLATVEAATASPRTTP